MDEDEEDAVGPDYGEDYGIDEDFGFNPGNHEDNEESNNQEPGLGYIALRMSFHI
jgi:hypothetical protein